MDADRLTALMRSWSNRPTRRDLTRALSGTVLAAPVAALLGPFDTAARKKHKKKKKTCKGGQKKCGKKCIPASACCTSCGENGACVSGTCTCFSGFRPCNGTCIPEEDCCTDDDCESGGVCSNGQCRCLQGFKQCGEACIPEDDCCTDVDCEDVCTTCQGGTCTGGCGVGQTCLANGSCGKTCNNDTQCNIDNNNPTCACAAEEGDEPVCRVLAISGVCESAPTCTTTENCAAGSVCVSNCSGPKRCLALCEV